MDEAFAIATGCLYISTRATHNARCDIHPGTTMKPPDTDTLTTFRRNAGHLLRPWRLVATCVVVGALTTACGGGDATTPTVAATLEKANMVPAAQKANDGFLLFDVAQLASAHFGFGNDWFDNGEAYTCSALFSDSEADNTSGTVTFISSRPGGDLQVGDTLTVAYNNCLMDPEEEFRLNGMLTLKVNSTYEPILKELGLPWSYKVTTRFDNFTMFSLDERAVIDGEMVVTESSSGFINDEGDEMDERFTTSFETANIVLSEDADTHAYTHSNGTLVKNKAADGNWTATINSDLNSNTFTGTINFATVEPFRGMLDSSTPSEGLGRIKLAQQPQQLLLRAQPTGVQGALTHGQSTESFLLDWPTFLQ